MDHERIRQAMTGWYSLHGVQLNIKRVASQTESDCIYDQKEQQKEEAEEKGEAVASQTTPLPHHPVRIHEAHPHDG